jgi:hypothetical protein
MKPLLLALLLSFTPSPEAEYHDCFAWQRTMEAHPWLADEALMTLPEAVPCEVLYDPEWGEGWAEAGCTQPLCAFCVFSVRDGVRSECGEVTAYVEDLR